MRMNYRTLRRCDVLLSEWFLCCIMVLTTDGELLCNLNDPDDCSCVSISRGPTSTDAIFEGVITLPCAVENVVGEEVQWTKDGVALGTDQSIPGYPRYSMSDNSGNSFAGNYDITISNIQLEDEAIYQCQVTRCNLQSEHAYVTVLVPPTGPIILGAEDGYVKALVDVQIAITCEAWNAKPVADVLWFKGNDQIIEGIDKKVYQSESALQNSSTSLTLTPVLTDDEEIYTCIMNNDALVAENPEVISAQKTDISLYVLVPPTPPLLKGYEADIGQITVSEHDKTFIECFSNNGKPAPSIQWFRDGMKVTEGTKNETSPPDIHGRSNVSAILTIIGNISDDGITFTCSVMSESLTSPSEIYFVLNVSSKSPMSMAWIFIICFVTVMILIILIGLIYVILHRRKKTGKDVSESTSNPDQTATENQSSSSSPEASILQLPGSVDQMVSQQITHSAIQNAFSATSGDTSPEYGYVNETVTNEIAALSNEDISQPPMYSLLHAVSSHGSVANLTSSLPLDGDVFSLSSSLTRSNRGSPVENIAEHYEIFWSRQTNGSFSVTRVDTRV